MSSRSEIQAERDKYARASDRAAGQMYGQMSGVLWGIISNLIDSLTTDERGRIVFNVSNISTANRVWIAVQTFNDSSGFSFLRWAFGRLISLFGLNKRYFESMPDVQPESVEDRVRRLTLLRYGYNPDNGLIDPEGYLAANIRSSSQGAEVARRINQAIASRMNLNQFKREFRSEFQKAGSPLSVQYHYNRFARDLFQEYDRTVQMVYADELGLKHAVFAGTEKDNTRCFCLQRLNLIYTDKVIQDWNKQDWQGKKPGVDVRIALGGYNCRHILSWMTDGTAKAVAAKRSIEIDSYHQNVC